MLALFGTITAAVAAFVATGFDEILLLTILFVHASKRNNIKSVYLGQQLGMAVLLLISILAVYGINLVPREWIGILGLLPILQGIRTLFQKEEEEEDEEEEAVINRTKKYNSLFLSVALLTIAGGGEELAVYIPYLASLSSKELWITIITFHLLVPIWCTICKKLSAISHIHTILERYERIIIPIVFVGLGIFVILENNTLQAALDLFAKLS
ncbi:MAG: hypothetical protein K0S47_3540 [Herbinix sp.]|nr:hypothetical protein [Herbinix sp.]